MMYMLQNGKVRLVRKYKIIAICVAGIFQKQGMVSVQEGVLKVYHTLDTYFLFRHLRPVLIKNHTLPPVIVILDLLPGGVLFLGRPELMHPCGLQTIIGIKENNICTNSTGQGRMMPM